MGKHDKSRRNGQRRRRNDNNNDEAFIYLTIKVGVCILFIGLVITQIILLFWSNVSLHHTTTESKRERTTLPLFKLDSKRLQSDVFGMHDKFAKDNNNYKQHHEFYNEISRLKKQFSSIYGGDNAARRLIHSGVTTFTSNKRQYLSRSINISTLSTFKMRKSLVI